MNPEEVKRFYKDEDVVQHYAAAVHRVGLWASEERLFSRLFQPEQKLLEVGCGAGRIAFGLYNLGYRNLVAIDYSSEMIRMARVIAGEKSIDIPLKVGDATRLEFADASFEGAIFGFNGLMQIPSRVRRLKAMKEIRRVIRPGGLFYFTTHDRNHRKHRRYWKQDAKRWQSGRQRMEYEDIGDRIGDTDWGEMFIHIPTRGEIEEMLSEAGWQLIQCQPRSVVANEKKYVREFSDECLLWVVKKAVE